MLLDATREEHELYDSDGPLWYRGWATDSEEKACANVERVLAKTGTRRMIMGHTPDFEVRLVRNACHRLLSIELEHRLEM